MNSKRVIKDKNEVTYFMYSFKQLREFILQGRSTGDVGMIVVSRDKRDRVTYKGFGTIEHPFKNIMSISLQFDANFDTPQRPPISPMQSYTYEIINFK